MTSAAGMLLQVTRPSVDSVAAQSLGSNCSDGNDFRMPSIGSAIAGVPSFSQGTARCSPSAMLPPLPADASYGELEAAEAQQQTAIASAANVQGSEPVKAAPPADPDSGISVRASSLHLDPLQQRLSRLALQPVDERLRPQVPSAPAQSSALQPEPPSATVTRVPSGADRAAAEMALAPRPPTQTAASPFSSTPGGASPTDSPARRHQRSPSATGQPSLATGPQRAPPPPWPLPAYRPPLRPASPAARTAAATETAQLDPTDGFTAMSDAWERRTSPPGGIRRGSGLVPRVSPRAGAAGTGGLASADLPAITGSKLSSLLGAARAQAAAGGRGAAIAGFEPSAGGNMAAGRTGSDDGQSEHSESWRRQRRHFFILTNAGAHR